MTLRLEESIHWTLLERARQELVGAVADLLLGEAAGEDEREEARDDRQDD